MEALDQMTTTARIPATTGIGSLPHHNIDAALEFSFRMGIPFLPQIPIRNPWEYMIAQALEGLPGLQAEADGSVSLNLDVWNSRAHAFQKKLDQAFADADRNFAAFEAFEPSGSACSGWLPFLWELREQGKTAGKVQIAGPITAQWTMRIKDGTPADQHPDLTTQVYRLVLARSLAMIRRLRAEKIEPILFLDEPGLYAFSPQNPKHMLAAQELRLLIQSLRKEGAKVGLHCCSNPDWAWVFGLGLDIVSLDVDLSLDAALAADQGKAVETFLAGGGRLALGIIPTARSAVLHSLDVRDLFGKLNAKLLKRWESKPEQARKVLREALYTPACGLALHTTGDAELVLATLTEFERFCHLSVRS